MKQFYIYQEKNDNKIWQSIKKGNENAFSIVFQHYYNHIYNYGLTLTNDDELIKDVIQDVFINIWYYRKRLGDINSIKIYLLTSFRRSLMKKISKQKRSKSDHISIKSEYLNNEPSTEDVIINEQISTSKIKFLKQHIAKLSARQQEVIHLKFYHGLENQEIKEVMSLNYQSVRNLLHEAIKKLKQNLNGTSSFNAFN